MKILISLLISSLPFLLVANVTHAQSKTFEGYFAKCTFVRSSDSFLFAVARHNAGHYRDYGKVYKKGAYGYSLIENVLVMAPHYGELFYTNTASDQSVWGDFAIEKTNCSDETSSGTISGGITYITFCEAKIQNEISENTSAGTKVDEYPAKCEFYRGHLPESLNSTN